MRQISTQSRELGSVLSGKQLLKDEILQQFPSNELHYYLQKNFIELVPSIVKKKYTYSCNRCFNDQSYLFYEHPCTRCEKLCVYCRNCINMGKASTCNPIVKWIGPPVMPPESPSEPILQWNGTLSKPQEKASHLLARSVKTKTSTLVHAVCGAGKTEILFQAVEAALETGKRICIATPRRDVVQELFPRFQKAFPTTTIQALFGGSEHRNDGAHVTISTTHQLYRYQDAFDVMVIDEVDAFPNTADLTLQRAAKNAQKPDGTLIFLTATPTQPILSQVKKGTLQSVKIPARYHGCAVPEPKTKWIGDWKKAIEKNKVPYSLLQWLKPRILAKKPVLLFLPDIPSMLKLEKLLTPYTPKIKSVHAKDPDRGKKVEEMRKKEINLLLTTTILERGVTFSNVDVAVLGAEKTIFTESALVQIAGRAGRDRNFPEGDVTFFHHGHTEAILKAQRHIQQMNREARKAGLLKAEKA
ncbi:DEAD/DEAH box helicase [Jeotgalibacillus proteolyticus]|uniref:DNA/RNA helicase n=1 Tax=Jeotgalibacillus proteolyticus TaxID=2082395 RepID=A0A2S5GBG2_9BACL|nr:DEAD/DEAH box helicase [Jeotgalibacillus proteolyticus]PPA70255.1 DNA/RNA helicase [Jeotgalibacillus proteolyticus]